MSVIDHLIPHLLKVQKPARYLGGEQHAMRKDPSDKLRFGLAFPDVYEIGMSYTGLPLLYHLLNREPDLAAERVFCPWPDMEEMLRSTGVPLYMLESGDPVTEMDVLGFTLQYELTATNMLTMLSLAGIPFRSADRKSGPIVMAGGPGATNPEPLAPFIDVFYIGEAERDLVPVLRFIHRLVREQRDRMDILKLLAAEFPFLYVPFLHATNTEGLFHVPILETPVRRTFPDGFAASDLPDQQILPNIGVVHDRVTLEISRGCDEGCRFCQAGMIYRPARERAPEDLVAAADRLISRSGHDEVSLSSLSTSDYPGIEDLVRLMMNRFSEKRVSTALPSLRADRFREAFAEEIKRVRKTGFTIAPEAGSQRLRDVINKNLSESDILEAATIAYRHGWDHVKLYFMIGLPTETDEDLKEMVRLAETIARRAGRGHVILSVSTFVPKPHTPFQWAAMLDKDEIVRRQQFIRDQLRSRKIRTRFHDPGETVVEGWFSRGDRRMADVVEAAWGAGARFDGWMEWFNFAHWQAALQTTGVPVDHLNREIPVNQPLPWDGIDIGIPRSYQEDEWEKAMSATPTPYCDTADNCNSCRACSPAVLKRRFAERDRIRQVLGEMESTTGHMAPEPEQRYFYRFLFAKTGLSRFISHLDLVHVLNRALRMAELPVAFTRGFNPKPVLKFGPALELGVAGDREPFIGEFTAPLTQQAVETLNNCLPEGIRILELSEVEMANRKQLSRDARLQYRVTMPVAVSLKPDWRDATLVKKGKRGDRTVRLGDMVDRVEVSGSQVRIIIRHSQSGGSLRLSEALSHLFPEQDPAHAIMVRQHILYELEEI